ncbi:hypothetical protein AWB68_07895 [Caballeronia choica]|uniref:Uncharacterized protein n=2 Tax=Caballeronia choica TaxID=326476 RepID=A0A158L079_9BURK|nr:hypothetical protein AWB68_07895 [Caballeronia choica]
MSSNASYFFSAGTSMKREYQYKNYIVDVSVRAEFRLQKVEPIVRSGYNVSVRLLQDDPPVAQIMPIRHSEVPAKMFCTEVEALMAGYSAGRRLADSLMKSEAVCPIV